MCTNLTNLSIRLQRHFVKYEHNIWFKYGFSMFSVVAIKFHGTESSIAEEKCMWVYCSLEDKKLPNKRLYVK